MSDFSLDSHFRSTRRSAHPKSVYPATAVPREPFESGSISSAEWRRCCAVRKLTRNAPYPQTR